jgi:uncharacterized membrane protein (DUF4010 family)
MEDFDLIGRLALALAIGLLVGIERGWQARERGAGERIAGVRTFALIGLLGGVWGLLGKVVGDLGIALAGLALTVLLLSAYVVRMRQSKDLGITTMIAALLVFALGVLAVRGDMIAAAGIAVVAVVFLESKEPLHRWLQQLQRFELAAAIRLLLISVVLLPLLPNRGFGPGEVLNPYQLWWMVVLVAGLSFIGYFAIRLTGPRTGPLLTGFLGGLASSTALTFGFARLAGATPTLAPALAGGIVIAAAVMFIRMLVLTAVVAPALVWSVAGPTGVMALVCLLGAGLMVWRDKPPPMSPDLEISDPVALVPAIGFGLLLGAVMLASHLVSDLLGEPGLLGLAALSGLVDVDAITLSLARLAGGTTAETVIVAGMLVAALVNTLVKLGAVAWLGPQGLLVKVAPVLLAAVAAGFAVLAAST